MAFRGRGRGRGFSFGFRADKQEPFKLFPEDVSLPDKNCVPLDADYFKWNYKLQVYFESSAYFVEESASQDGQNHDIERYSDWNKPRNKSKREALSDYMKLERGYFPTELVEGVKARPKKKVKWSNQDSKKLDLLEKREKAYKERGLNDEAKDGSDEDEDEEAEEEEEEYSTDGDYEKMEDFDDDEDDFNDVDDGDDEPEY